MWTKVRGVIISFCEWIIRDRPALLELSAHTDLNPFQAGWASRLLLKAHPPPLTRHIQSHGVACKIGFNTR